MKESGFMKILVSIHLRVLHLYLIHRFPCLQSCCVLCTLHLEEVSDDEFIFHQQVKMFAVSCGGTGWERLCHFLLTSGKDWIKHSPLMVLTDGTVSLCVFLPEYQTFAINATSIFSGFPFTCLPHLKQQVYRKKLICGYSLISGS